MPALPFKLNQDRRHHILRQKRKVTNSAAYDAALRQRGSLTIWFSDDAIKRWRAQPRTTVGGQPWYPPLAILTLEVPCPQARRNGEALHLPADSTGLKLCGAGEWLVEKHGAKTRPSWRTLHIGMDAGTGQIIAAVLTRKEIDDGSRVGPLLDQAAASVASFTADGAERHPEASVGRFKQVIGDGLRSRTDERRATEANVAVHAPNRMLDLGRPNSVRVA